MSNFTTYQKRHLLYEQLPLETPLSIHVCPSSYCNFKCSYCVHSISNGSTLPNGLKKSFMSLETFNKIIVQLKKFPQKLKLLNFAYLGEPLLNNDISQMVYLAKSYDIAERVEIVSNASLLNHSISQKLVESGLDRLRISIQGLNEQEYYTMSKCKINYDNMVEEIRYLYNISRNTGTKIYIKTVDSVVESEQRKKQFNNIFYNCCDNLNIENLVPISSECDISDIKKEFNNGFLEIQ